jgi:hypothetical protein
MDFNYDESPTYRGGMYDYTKYPARDRIRTKEQTAESVQRIVETLNTRFHTPILSMAKRMETIYPDAKINVHMGGSEFILFEYRVSGRNITVNFRVHVRTEQEWIELVRKIAEAGRLVK